MSVRETVGAPGRGRKPGAVLFFLPTLIVILGVAAIYLGQLSAEGPAGFSGYGIDETITGALAPAETGQLFTLEP